MKTLHTNDGLFQITVFEDIRVARIYLTKEGRSSLGEIITMVPRLNEGRVVKPDQPIFSLETTRALKCLVSPVGGHIVRINPLVDQNPNDITSEDCIMELHPINGWSSCIV